MLDERNYFILKIQGAADVKGLILYFPLTNNTDQIMPDYASAHFLVSSLSSTHSLAVDMYRT